MKYRPYSKRIERNLMKCWSSAPNRDEGMSWYYSGNTLCASMAGRLKQTVEAVCGVVAALSPGRNWELNLRDAEVLLSAFQVGKRGKSLPLVGSYGWSNIEKSERILCGEQPLAVLGGLKVRAFFSCLSNPVSSLEVCLDRHAKSAAYGMALSDPGYRPAKETGMNTMIRPAEYQWLARHFFRGAEMVGVLPNQFQAVCWVNWRRAKQL